MSNSSLTQDYFDDVYRQNTDPWNFETSEYEKAKYADTISVLTDAPYDQTFEIGCSIGVLTGMLASKTNHLLSVDVADAALSQAKKRLEGRANVEFRKMSVPGEFPDGLFDLIIISEVGYYLSLEDLGRLRSKVMEHLTAGGSLLLVHWLPIVHDYPLTGDQVHEYFYELASPGGPLTIAHSDRKEKYRLDLFKKL